MVDTKIVFVHKFVAPLNLGSKMPLGTFGLEFGNNIFIFEINTLELVQLQNFAQE